ncbi:class I SAM-dependent methyltransferase [Haloarcula pelagica]|uniref:class I SAM-dependent methyltransferase n=1 Tax=Haloarcula pelagica TaxID=3033389 RepID=UPI0024C221B3|nr:methyltransferase domain-containing protein [Halomicroarcula sp. YJ-61-S]
MTDVQAFYGRWARLYDAVASLPFVGSWRARAVESLALSPGETIVEMGCGTGANVPHLRERVSPGGTVLGIDLTREMVDQARHHPDRAGDGVHYVQGDAARPPVTDADAVLATFVAGLFPDPEPVVDRWCDTVGPGGRVALLNFQRSEAAAAAPLNVAFEGFVRLSSPGSRLARDSQATAFERRVRAARERLAERTVDRRYETLAGGYLGLLSGRVA